MSLDVSSFTLTASLGQMPDFLAKPRMLIFQAFLMNQQMIS